MNCLFLCFFSVWIRQTEYFRVWLSCTGELFDFLVVHGCMKEKEARQKFRQVLPHSVLCLQHWWFLCWFYLFDLFWSADFIYLFIYFIYFIYLFVYLLILLICWSLYFYAVNCFLRIAVVTCLTAVHKILELNSVVGSSCTFCEKNCNIQL